MDSFLLQDWTTINGHTGGVLSVAYTIAQSETGWLDLEPYDDVVFYTDVRQIMGAPSIAFETAPAPEDSAFQMLVPSIVLAAASAPRVDRALASVSLLPLARFVRWKMTASTGVPFGATFRIWLVAYGPGC